MQVNEEMVDQAIEDEHQMQEEQAKQAASREQLRLQLAAMQKQAQDQIKAARRDGSRTPRRAKDKDLVDLTLDKEAGKGQPSASQVEKEGGPNQAPPQ